MISKSNAITPTKLPSSGQTTRIDAQIRQLHVALVPLLVVLNHDLTFPLHLFEDDADIDH
jgi:hypothetical protein